jgi:hypothetical protein
MAALPGWGWFAAWAGAGFLLAFSLVSAASIGLLIVPFALLALWAILRASPPRWTAFGLVSGAGSVGVLIWVLNRDSRPCPESGELTVPAGGTSIECGGFDALPFLAAGLVLTLACPALVAGARRSGRRRRLG